MSCNVIICFKTKSMLYSLQNFLSKRKLRFKTTNATTGNLYIKTQQLNDANLFIHASNDMVLKRIATNMTVIENFISKEEEISILDEIEPYMSRLKYESSHWDDAIHGFRETEKKRWQPENQIIINRLIENSFPPQLKLIPFIHVLDLHKDGVIKPHVDSVKFCGDIISGISLLSSCVMKLIHVDDANLFAYIFLPRWSMYIMRYDIRYNFTHEILGKKDSFFNSKLIVKERRISIIARCEPKSIESAK